MELGKKIPIQQSIIEDTDCNITVSGFGWYDSENPKKVDKRYLLEINTEKINNKNIKWKKCLNVIMLNPSQAKTDIENEHFVSKGNFYVDNTITNVIKIAKDNGYNIINVLNLFSKIQSDSNKVDFKIIDTDNIDKVIQYINKNENDIFLAWGCRFKFNTRKVEIVKLLDNLKNKQVLVLNNELTYPKHPGRMSISTIRNKYGNREKVKLKPYIVEI